mmetsp:Transcript_25099/g.94865  ORF Transcript_25099/g.94865 Transcript_25099/m.94865 type:complete len:299 (-) Transcript_25099:1955-2851(-)
MRPGPAPGMPTAAAPRRRRWGQSGPRPSGPRSSPTRWQCRCSRPAPCPMASLRTAARLIAPRAAACSACTSLPRWPRAGRPRQWGRSPRRSRPPKRRPSAWPPRRTVALPTRQGWTCPGQLRLPLRCGSRRPLAPRRADRTQLARGQSLARERRACSSFERPPTWPPSRPPPTGREGPLAALEAGWASPPKARPLPWQPQRAMRLGAAGSSLCARHQSCPSRSRPRPTEAFTRSSPRRGRTTLRTKAAAPTRLHLEPAAVASRRTRGARAQPLAPRRALRRPASRPPARAGSATGWGR